MKKSKTQRISYELDKEIRKFADKNNLQFTEATRKIAKIIGNKQNKKVKIVEEIKF